MAATHGTEERIVAVYKETIDALYAYVSRSCYGDRALAEDVTQGAWLRAVRDWRRKGTGSASRLADHRCPQPARELLPEETPGVARFGLSSRRARRV